jgi:hypothetical protein
MLMRRHSREMSTTGRSNSPTNPDFLLEKPAFFREQSRALKQETRWEEANCSAPAASCNRVLDRSTASSQWRSRTACIRMKGKLEKGGRSTLPGQWHWNLDERLHQTHVVVPTLKRGLHWAWWRRVQRRHQSWSHARDVAVWMTTGGGDGARRSHGAEVIWFDGDWAWRWWWTAVVARHLGGGSVWSEDPAPCGRHYRPCDASNEKWVAPLGRSALAGLVATQSRFLARANPAS